MSEQIHGFVIRNRKVVIAVTSHGCTEAEHFRLQTESGIAGFMLTIVRTQEDNCRMVAHVREFEMDIPEEIGNKPFTIQNPFVQGPMWMGVAPAEPPQ